MTALLLCGTGNLRAQTPETAASEAAALTQKLAMPNPIAASDSPWLEELTWLELRDRINAGNTTVIVPTGGVEENGPYLSTGKHNVILEATCPAIAQKLGNALCAPIVKFVPEGSIEPPSGHMRFAGTISLSDRTYRALLEDIVVSLKQHGFTDLVLIGDSGGNQSGLQDIALALNERWAGQSARVHFVREYYDPGWSATKAYTREVLGVDQTDDDGFHDDIWVTAQMMVSDPRQVRHAERVEAGLASINGVSIADLEATRELGRQMVEFRAELTVRAIRDKLATE